MSGGFFMSSFWLLRVKEIVSFPLYFCNIKDLLCIKLTPLVAVRNAQCWHTAAVYVRPSLGNFIIWKENLTFPRRYTPVSGDVSRLEVEVETTLSHCPHGHIPTVGQVSRLWETDSRSSRREFPRVWWEQKIYVCVRQRPPLVSFFCRLNPS